MAGPKILVANNDTAFLHLMDDLLTEEGYQVTLTSANDQAYDLIRKDPPDLVILDIGLDEPGNGWNVLDLLKLDPGTAGIPVIVSSVDTRFLRAKEPVLRDKGCEILEKPFALEELLNKVNRAIGR